MKTMKKINIYIYLGSQLKFDFRKGTSKGEKEIIIEIFAGKFTKRKNTKCIYGS